MQEVFVDDLRPLEKKDLVGFKVRPNRLSFIPTMSVFTLRSRFAASFDASVKCCSVVITLPAPNHLLLPFCWLPADLQADGPPPPHHLGGAVPLSMQLWQQPLVSTRRSGMQTRRSSAGRTEMEWAAEMGSKGERGGQ